MSTFAPRLDILPTAQRALWPELAAVPAHFVLYGGTGLALRLGHRQSVDFDFFSSAKFTEPELPFLREAEVLQRAPATFTLSVQRAGAPVKLSFFGGFEFGRVGQPDRAADNQLAVAALLDIAATKMKVVQERAEARDYLDVAALLTAGIDLASALGAATALFGNRFNAAITLKALTYYEDGNLGTLPAAVRRQLTMAATRVGQLPVVDRASEQLAP